MHMLSAYIDLDESGFVEGDEEDDAIPGNQQHAKEVLKKARCLE